MWLGKANQNFVHFRLIWSVSGSFSLIKFWRLRFSQITSPLLLTHLAFCSQTHWKRSISKLFFFLFFKIFPKFIRPRSETGGLSKKKCFFHAACLNEKYPLNTRIVLRVSASPFLNWRSLFATFLFLHKTGGVEVHRDRFNQWVQLKLRLLYHRIFYLNLGLLLYYCDVLK